MANDYGIRFGNLFKKSEWKAVKKELRTTAFEYSSSDSDEENDKINKIKKKITLPIFSNKKFKSSNDLVKGEKKHKTEKEEKSPMYYCSKILIQKYIENPLLYKGRKCDMRGWVLITHNMKVYFFKEGHLKTCSISFDIDSKNAFSHITNYSFQK